MDDNEKAKDGKLTNAFDVNDESGEEEYADEDDQDDGSDGYG